MTIQKLIYQVAIEVQDYEAVGYIVSSIRENSGLTPRRLYNILNGTGKTPSILEARAIAEVISEVWKKPFSAIDLLDIYNADSEGGK